MKFIDVLHDDLYLNPVLFPFKEDGFCYSCLIFIEVPDKTDDSVRFPENKFLFFIFSKILKCNFKIRIQIGSLM